MNRLRLGLVLLLLLAACQKQSSLEPTRGDRVPERTMSGDVIAATFRPEGGFFVSEVLDAPAGATRVGIMATLEPGQEQPQWMARGYDAAGEPGPWVALEVTWSENEMRVARADFGFDAYGAELRVDDPSAIASLTWSAVVPVPPRTEAPSEFGSVQQPLRAELQDLVQDRASWGARATNCSDRDGDKTRMAIHHTVTPSTTAPETRLRGIQAFHMDTRGWCDVGYHFLVSMDGTIWEGRELEYIGAHVGGHNTGNAGISFIGCHHTSGCNDWEPFDPPEAPIDATATLVGRLANLYDITVNPMTVKGHRDHSGATTSCPGDFLHDRLDDIRERAGSSGGVLRAEYVSQSFPLASQEFVLRPGEVRGGELVLRNTGTVTWEPGETFLATTEPREGDSPIAGPDWDSPSVVTSVERSVAPGSTGRFAFSVRGPLSRGEYAQYFNLRQGDTWFTTPPDDQLQIRVSVEMDAPMDAGMPDAGFDAQVPRDAGMADSGVFVTPADDGCGCRTSDPMRPGAGLWMLLGAVFFARRRRR